MNKTKIKSLTLYHEVDCLGSGVAKAVVTIINRYAALASLDNLPPISLSGSAFGRPWDEIKAIEGCSGNSGSGDEEERFGISYQCLSLSVPSSPQPRVEAHPTTLEGVIAHEIVHLRWWKPRLRHGPEFNARVLALLRGAQFPRQGRWTRLTKQTVAHTRKESREFMAALLSRGDEQEQAEK
jgi:hypothetical protein